MRATSAGRSPQNTDSPTCGTSAPSKKPEPERLLQSLYHEATHAILSKAVGDTPLWFNEGSAEYFSKIMVSQTRIGQEVFREGLGPCKIMARQNRLPALETVLRYDV